MFLAIIGPKSGGDPDHSGLLIETTSLHGPKLFMMYQSSHLWNNRRNSGTSYKSIIGFAKTKLLTLLNIGSRGLDKILVVLTMKAVVRCGILGGICLLCSDTFIKPFLTISTKWSHTQKNIQLHIFQNDLNFNSAAFKN